MFNRRQVLAGGLSAFAPLVAPRVARAFDLDPKFVPQEVTFDPGYEPGQLVVLPRAHFLYFVTAPGRARRYGVGVGRAGLEFTGIATIDVKKEWPTWRPTDEMLERDPEDYERFIEDEDYIQPGGPDNPLGSRALYLFQDGRDTYYRIHGTPEPESIGRSVSNGCIRMVNAHVQDLYERVPIGTVVTVL